MTHRRKQKVAQMLPVAVAAISLITSCKGRTLENVEPTGDTIEVTIDMPATDTAHDIATQQNK